MLLSIKKRKRKIEVIKGLALEKLETNEKHLERKREDIQLKEEGTANVTCLMAPFIKVIETLLKQVIDKKGARMSSTS